MPLSPNANELYSTTTGMIFLFNLIVGTGALALPGAFQKSGWILGVCLLVLVAFVSYITVTFLIECLAVSNGIATKRYEEGIVEDTPLVSQEGTMFEIREKYELGQMSVLITPRWCQVIVYLSICIYLFGDLSIYVLVVGQTLSHVICYDKLNVTDSGQCWPNYEISRINIYRICTFSFILLLGPFVFFNLQKTKALQIFSAGLRWLSFFIMLCWSTYKIFRYGDLGHPKLANFTSLPTIFGCLVYAFMCQHSIPGLLLPIKKKKHLNKIVKADFCIIICFYLLLTMTAIYAFPHISEIYTLSFSEEVNRKNSNKFLIALSYFLALFPVFTLSTSFPIIAITLRNNLRALFLKSSPNIWYYDKLIFPLVAILPPFILTLAVRDLHVLVGIVGSYAGASVQYLVPCLLINYARREAQAFNEPNPYSSPFKSKIWVIIVYIWMFISLILITFNYILKWL